MLTRTRRGQGIEMDMMYDVVIIGAGQAGLMAVKVAAEQNLKVVLIERKEKIPEVQRTCRFLP